MMMDSRFAWFKRKAQEKNVFKWLCRLLRFKQRKEAALEGSLLIFYYFRIAVSVPTHAYGWVRGSSFLTLSALFSYMPVRTPPYTFHRSKSIQYWRESPRNYLCPTYRHTFLPRAANACKSRPWKHQFRTSDFFTFKSCPYVHERHKWHFSTH